MKAACLFVLLTIHCCGFAQTKAEPQRGNKILIGRCMDGTTLHTELEYEVSNSDTVYTLNLRNAQYSNLEDYQSILFSGDGRVLNQLYSTLKSVFTDKNRKRNGYSLIITLGGKLVVINTARILGLTCIAINLPKGYCYLTERQVDKIFGKI